MRTSRAAVLLAAAGGLVILASCAGSVRRPNAAPVGHTAQSSDPATDRFSDLPNRLREGTRARLTLAEGRVEGVVAGFTDEAITLIVNGKPDAFPCARVRRVQRRGDSVWSGALIGAAIVALPAWNGCQNKGRNLTCVAVGMGLFGAIGALLDKSHEGWTTLYVASDRSCATP